jgi:hypothetical protein
MILFVLAKILEFKTGDVEMNGLLCFGTDFRSSLAIFDNGMKGSLALKLSYLSLIRSLKLEFFVKSL